MRGDGLLRALEGIFLRADRAVARALPEELNPLAQTGAIANTSLLVAIASGALLLFWYSTSVHTAWSSLEHLRGGSFLGQLTRSVHRYSSDGCLFFVGLHALRMLFARRFAGPRVLAWVTGAALVVLLWLVGWLGYWLVWDVRGQQVALGTARVLDALPIFSDPPSRGFLTDGGVSSLLFFIVFFAHMLIPLAMGIALWLHITRLSRSRFLTGRAMTVAVVSSLVAMSVAVPALNAAPAQMAVTPGAFSIDAWYLLPLYLTDRLGAGALWGLSLAGTALFCAVPWLLARGRAPVAVVDVPSCNGCKRCYEDCPYQAITLVPRTDGRGFDVQAQVDEGRCVGCGICSGSCNSSAIELPWLSVNDERRRLDAWIDDAVRESPDVHVAIVCAESAGAELEVDPETGRCDALPGYRVVLAPCAGWVNMLTVERAIRHGASGVLLGACGPGDCQYREGGEWTTLRTEAERAPALRHEKVAPERVLVSKRNRSDVRGFVADADALRRRAKPERPRLSRARTLAAGAALAAALGGCALAVARVPYAGPPPTGPELVVSFKHPGRLSERCRVPTPEENARVPVHMRRDRICERGRSPVRMRVTVDGAEVLARSYAPRGLHRDEASVVLERIAVPAGDHAVRLEIGDSADANEWSWRDERTLRFAPGRRVVALFDRSRLFDWESPRATAPR